jgi:hypothetical protein
VDFLNLLQWPAMAVTVTASWLVASVRPGQRNAGFWVFLLSNVLWVAWGIYASAPALIVLQIALAALNIRGARKAEVQEQKESGQGDPEGGTDRRT